MTTTLAGVLPPAIAVAQPAPSRGAAGATDIRNYSIQPGPLAQALNRFADASQLQLVYSGATTQGLRSPGVNGAYTKQQALAHILAGSGLTYRFSNATTVTIELSGSAAAGGNAADGTVELDTINVSDVFRSPWQINPDLPFETPAAVSVVTRAQINEVTPTNPRDVLTGIPGVNAVGNTYDPAIAVSIRGMQDFGRVNMMIDGVRQTFSFTGHYTEPRGTLYVDPAMLAGVEVQRGAVSTTGGAGTLVGTANFRTISIDDILKPDQKYGVQATGIYGTNGYDWSGIVSGGARVSDSFDVFGAVSGRDSSGYEDGYGNYFPNAQKLTSALFKTNINPYDDHYLQIGAIYYNNEFDYYSLGNDMSVETATGTVKYRWQPTDTDLVNLAANGYVTWSNMKAQDYLLSNASTSYDDTGFGGDISNTSKFSVGQVNVTAVYGAEYSYDIIDTETFGGDGNYAFSTPSGDRGVGGIFSQTTLNWGIFDLIGGLRYDVFTLTGAGYNEFTNIIVPIGPYEVDDSEGKLLPKITLAVTPWEGVQFYGLWGETWRPPAVTEALVGGQHVGLAGIWFSPNPYLVPEESEGWEVGFNLLRQNVFKEGDTLRFKMDYFSTDVTNYISYVRTQPNNNIIYSYQNVPGITKLEGFEMEAGYDMGSVFATVAYQNIETTYPAFTGTGQAWVKGQPPETLTATVGVRLLDQRLTLGARVNQMFAFNDTYQEMPSYTTYDAFGSYKFSDLATAFFSVENVGNEQYAPPFSVLPGPGLTAKFGLTGTFAK